MSVEELYNKLQEAKDCTSLLKKYLTPKVLLKLKDRKTKYGGTLANCIRAGCVSLSHGTGIHVPDPDSYKVFSDLLQPILLESHMVDVIDHPDQDLGNITNLPFSTIDDGKYIISTRICVGRSIQGYSFSPIISTKDRIPIEEMIIVALSNLPEDLKGKYHPLASLGEEKRKELLSFFYMVPKNQRMMQESGAYRDWPDNRGIFFSKDKKLMVWVNEEEHLNIFSVENGSDLGSTYKRFVQVLLSLGKRLAFEKHDGLGYVSSCPTSLGTSIHASVNIRIPRLSQQPNFQDILTQYSLEARSVEEVDTQSVEGVYDVSYKRSLSLTEIDAMVHMATGIKSIVYLENQLEG